jgi:hypothetical protein
MARPRSALVLISDTPWYHVVSRCVRRAFLCGDDRLSGQNFDHRRAWIVERVKQLAYKTKGHPLCFAGVQGCGEDVGDALAQMVEATEGLASVGVHSEHGHYSWKQGVEKLAAGAALRDNAPMV